MSGNASLKFIPGDPGVVATLSWDHPTGDYQVKKRTAMKGRKPHKTSAAHKVQLPTVMS